MKTNTVRIVLADENRLFIDSLMMLIGKLSPRIKVVDTAKDSSDALKKTKKEQPDILLLDINLPGIDGPEFLKLIHSESPKTKIVILTDNDKYDCIKESLKNKISGYLLKNIALSELIAMFPLINDKTIILSQELIPLILEYKTSVSNKNNKADDSQALPSAFSAHERKILNFIIKGFSNREIAEKMHLAEQTVKNYVSSIYVKLGVHNRSQAIRIGKSVFQ